MSAFDSLHRHRDVRLLPDSARVILRPFLPGSSVLHDGSERIDVVLARLQELTERDVAETLASTRELFAHRHRPVELDGAIEENFANVEARLENVDALSGDRRRLIGMYFTHEYSIEAAALGNPSIVVAPDQQGIEPGALRVVMSLRSVGEGHRSSISLRTAVIAPDGQAQLEPVDRYVSTGRRSPAVYDRSYFRERLAESSLLDDFGMAVLDGLDEAFGRPELDRAIHGAVEGSDDIPDETVARYLTWLADSNYVVEFEPTTTLSERVLFPSGPSETQGMEDARMVRFVDDDGSVVYYGTYTAFDGRNILPQLFETTDFTRFRVATLRGACAQNKGIAIFPRKIGGEFFALGRHDNVNNFVMRSASVREWRTSDLIQEPNRPWELTQLGNCGSPIETPEGWLVITHGVGAMRRYVIGALLLDLDDPSVVIGHSREPLIEPDASERDGYVPNVVYSCGALIHGERLYIPYGFSDFGASLASIPVGDVLAALS